jgi:hypothetical protein
MLAQTYTERAATTLSQILVLEITPAMANICLHGKISA